MCDFPNFLSMNTLSLDSNALGWLGLAGILGVGGLLGHEHHIQNWEISPDIKSRILEKLETQHQAQKESPFVMDPMQLETMDGECESAPMHTGSIIVLGLGWLLFSVACSMSRRNDLAKLYNQNVVQFNPSALVMGVLAGTLFLLYLNQVRKQCSFLWDGSTTYSSLLGASTIFLLLALATTIPISNKVTEIKIEGDEKDENPSPTCEYQNICTGMIRSCTIEDVIAGEPQYYEVYTYSGKSVTFTLLGLLVMCSGYFLYSRDRVFSSSRLQLKDMMFSPALPVLVVGVILFLVGCTVNKQ